MGGYDLELLRTELGELLHFHAEVDSTNEQALLLGREGAPGGSVVVAERQLAGRGRRGASWFCGEGAGLAFSILLRPDFSKALWPRLSLVAGLAVARSIEAAGLAPTIKWPNDVLLGSRKVCGILVEAGAEFVVVGIGLNVGASSLPDEIQGLATSLAEEGAQERTREEHLLGITADFLSLQKGVAREFEDLLAMVRTRCALTGKRIRFQDGLDAHQGLCQGIGDGGDLLVKENGSVKRYLAADRIRIVEPQ